MIVLLALAAAAAPAPADPGYDRCMQRAVTNPDFAACGTALVARREAELNRTWKAAFARLDAPTKAELLSEQRLWIAFKDKSCRYWTTGSYGREGQTVHFYTCRAEVIAQRIVYLGDIGNMVGPDRDKDIATGRRE
jgi:uncharacterized protein YecT (DUF1311 family)